MTKHHRKKIHEPGFLEQISKLGKSKESGVIVPATFLAIAVLDVIPTPTDIGYFYTEKWLQQNQNNPNYWIYKTVNYYGWDVLWYVTLFGVTYLSGKTISDKMKAGVGVVSLGAITYMLWKFSTHSNN
jgi:hypothetical protein